jgi:uncharacterized protein involved in exopolysaccharide biosynthesis
LNGPRTDPVYFCAAVDDDIDLLEFSRILWNARRTIAIATLAVTALAVAAAFFMTPVYRAEAVVMEVDSAMKSGDTAAALLGQFSGLAALANVNLVKPTIARTTLRSRSLAEEFIARHQLLKLLFADNWMDRICSWNDEVQPQPRISDAGNCFLEKVLEVTTDADSGTITIAVEWRDPQVAADWANGIVALANETLRARDVAEARSNVEFLNHQIADTNIVELQRALSSLLENEQKTIMLAHSRDEYSFKVIDAAIAPRERVRPARLLMAIAGVFVGAFLGLMIVLVRRFAARLRQPA